MTSQDIKKIDKKLYDSLKIDCSRCFGLCCAALYFSASEGFPADKQAGKPCLNLQWDFCCGIHQDLRKKGFKGCTAYDCLGAGQKIAQVTYSGQSWQEKPELAKQMFDVFLIMKQIHEMLWYLAEAFRAQTNDVIKSKLKELIDETDSITHENVDFLIKFDIEAHRDKVNSLLRQTSEVVRTRALRGQKNNLKQKKTIAGRLNLFGADLRKANLRGADLRGAFLIAANLSGNDLSGADLIGADLRDTDLRGTNLEKSLFLTQSQINAAKGDVNTKLPVTLEYPSYWEK